MKAQAEKFQITAQALKQEGAKITVHGDGLLQQMYNAPPQQLSERDKYRTIWQFDTYRDYAPGEFAVPLIERFFSKPGPVIDFGCGTGRASLRLKEAGYDVMLVDFADNCRDDEALNLPFLEWDLSKACPLRAPLGICCDVMEHIPTDDVDAVIRNIMGSAQTVFFQISTVPDAMGEIIHEKLHMTVKPHGWWLKLFESQGHCVQWQENRDDQSSFLVQRKL
jgi:SAM-dependent methyltransferase